MYEIKEIGQQIALQDNQCTANPIFLVEQKERLYGFDENCGEGPVWIDSDGYEASVEVSEKLEDDYTSDFTEPDFWTRTFYNDCWRFVTVFFTEKAARQYIKDNAHHFKYPHNEARVFVDSLNRNSEMKAVRNHLIGLANE